MSGIIDRPSSGRIILEHCHSIRTQHIAQHCNTAIVERCNPVNDLGAFIKTNSAGILILCPAYQPLHTGPRKCAKAHGARFRRGKEIVVQPSAIAEIVPAQNPLSKN